MYMYPVVSPLVFVQVLKYIYTHFSMLIIPVDFKKQK